jgi:hypothetical protein
MDWAYVAIVMKTKTPSLSAVLSLMTLITMSGLALAQPRPGGPPRGPGGPPPGGGSINEPRPMIPTGDLGPLGPMQDKFAAFVRAQLEGEKYYKKDEESLFRKHADLRRLIVESMISDKISEDQGNGSMSQLCEIGQKHLTTGEINTATAMDALEKDVREQSRERVSEALLTPEVNRAQVLMSDLIRFTATDSKLSNKTTSLKRRFDDLVADEQRFKKDGEVDDQERAKLTDAAAESWQEFIKILKR